MSKRDDALDVVHANVFQVLVDHGLSSESAAIGADAAVRALSGREMSARDVWEKLHHWCRMHAVTHSPYRCASDYNFDGPCDMAHCPSLR